jgi:hypothetical protein
VSESKKNLDPNDPAYYAPPRSRDRNNDPVSSGRDRQALSVSRGLEEHLANLRAAKSGNRLPTAQSDVFADALSRMLREQIENGRGDMPSVLKKRSSVRIAAKLAVAVVSAAVVALAYVLFSAPQGAPDDGLWSALRSWQSTKSSATAALPPQRQASALVVHNHAGLVNEPLALGVSVDAADPGAAVTIKGMPPGARLTGGVPLSFTEWRVPADEISNVMVIPPADFVGELDLSAELRSSGGVAQVASFMQLTWKAAPPAAAAPTAPSTVPVAAAPAPQPQQPAPPVQQTAAPPQQPPPQSQPRPQAVASLPATTTTPPQPRADAVRELSPNEIAALVRRAQEMLANGDVKAGRALLLRATEARDARAALVLAKTYDPIALRQFSSADQGPDLAQARTWYQKAREWGAPEAQRQLDALASYSR